MNLIKFCKSDHNIRSGAKLRVGTLFQYRQIENADIQDGEEGNYLFEINFPEKIELDRNWSNLLFSGIVHFGGEDLKQFPRIPGGVAAHIDKMHIVEQRANSVVVEDTKVTLKRTSINSFIFCMSMMENAEKCPFEGYDDHWFEPFSSANQLANRMGELIFSQARLEAFDTSLAKVHSPTTIAKLSLNVRHQKVQYRDRSITVTPDNHISFEELYKTIVDIPFSKPLSYAGEREYRFVFDLVDGVKFYPPTVDYIDLELNALAKL
jgi:hypothetical protein